jgi:hypothetical protein
MHSARVIKRNRKNGSKRPCRVSKTRSVSFFEICARSVHQYLRVASQDQAALALVSKRAHDTHTRTHTHTNTHTYTHTHTLTPTCTHTHIYTHTHSHPPTRTHTTQIAGQQKEAVLLVGVHCWLFYILIPTLTQARAEGKMQAEVSESHPEGRVCCLTHV